MFLDGARVNFLVPASRAGKILKRGKDRRNNKRAGTAGYQRQNSGNTAASISDISAAVAVL